MKNILFLVLISWSVFAQNDNELIREFQHSESLYSIAFSPDGKFLATGSGDGNARIFEISTGKVLKVFHVGSVSSVAFSPDGKFIATGSYDKTASIYSARIFNINSGLQIKALQKNNTATSIAFSPDGKFLAVGSDDGSRIFDINLGSEVKSFTDNKKVSSLAFSSNGKFLGIGSDQKAIIFNINTGQEFKSFLKNKNVLSIAFSPDSKFLAAGSSDGSTRIFDLTSGLEVKTFLSDFKVYSVAFNPNGMLLANGSGIDATARIFAINTGRVIKSFLNHNSVYSVVFSPDGKFFATGSSDGLAKIFNINTILMASYLFFINQAFSPAELENERDYEITSINNIKKDEFETQDEFEKRKAESSSKISLIRDTYEQKIVQAQKKYEADQEAVKAIFQTKLVESLEKVESSYELGTYDVENTKFTLTIEHQNFEIKVPREFARDFKEQSSSLKAKGQKQLNEKLEWEYFNWSISTPNGQVYAFGEHRGANIQVAQSLSTQPPSLTAKVVFSEPSGNNALDADEKGKLTFTITNTGKGSAFGVEAKLTSSPIAGISTNSSLFIGEIAAGQSKSEVLELNASSELKDGNCQFNFAFDEARGFPPDPIKITLDTRAFIPPKFIISDVGVNEPSGNGRIENEEIIEVKARIQNIGNGVAKRVKGHFDLGANVFKTQETNAEFIIGDLAGGAYYDAVIKVYTNKIATELPIFITINESKGKYDIIKARLDPSKLALNVRVQQLQEVVFTGKNKTGADVIIAEGLSIDIEQNIPKTKNKNPDAIAVVIGIRDYSSTDIPSVTYAKRDAQVIRDYLVQTLGYDRKNILPQNPDELMTVGNMKSLMRQKLPAFIKPDGSSDVFVYYTGHGAPSTSSQQPFFVPYDCDPNYVSDDNAYKMLDFYGDIEKLKAKKKTVVIDACFSGETGDGKAIIKNASPILLKVNNPLLADKNAVVFQSSESNQVSNWYPEKKHSLFTYFFLKGLKGEADLNKDGKITVDEMEKYINDENTRLPYVSRREFQRPQKAVVNGNYEAVILDRQN